MSSPNDPNRDPNQFSSPFRPDHEPEPVQSNPYAAPSAIGGYSQGEIQGRHLGPGNMVRQVPVVGSLMIVQGGLVSLLAIGFVVLSFFMPSIINANQPPGVRRGGPPDELIQVIYGAFGAVYLVIGGLNIYAGIKLINYQRRVLAIVSLSIGVLSSLLCYCAPTAIGLAIYGMIVLLNNQTFLAFKLRQQGEDKNQMLRHFS